MLVYYLQFYVFHFLLFVANSDDKQLRALELNSWQLLRLIQAQLPGLSCRNFPCNGSTDDLRPRSEECSGGMEKMLCCLHTNAAILHSSWKSKKVSEWVSEIV